MSASVSGKFGTISSHCVTVTVGIAAHTVHVKGMGRQSSLPGSPCWPQVGVSGSTS